MKQIPENTKEQSLELISRLGEADVSTIVSKMSPKKSRQWVSVALNQLVKEGALVRNKKGKHAFFYFPVKNTPIGNEVSETLMNKSLDEDLVFVNLKEKNQFLQKLPENIDSILYYGFTEMLNNAIEHSGSKTIETMVSEIGERIVFDVIDHGVGVFKNIQTKKYLTNELEAIQELMKGKTTTPPHSHSGEGIFFTSKIADLFILDSFGYRLRIDNNLPDVFVEKIEPLVGTRVHFEIARQSKKHLNDIFKEYEAEPGSYAFDKTRIYISLWKAGTIYISRSQAKRLTNNLDKFKVIVLDFKGVQTVGQAFADEVFRVFGSKHPAIKLEPVNMSETVEFMVKRSINTKR